MKTIKALLTSSGSQVAPSLIRMIKRNKQHKISVVGVDAGIKNDLVGRHFCDSFYYIPKAFEAGYIPAIADICKKERIFIIFPASDEEALVLAHNRDKLSSLGTKIACSDALVIERSLDKLKLMDFLKNENIAVAEYYELKNIKDIKKYCIKLGYPEDKIVIKPRTARGSRGFRVITGKSNIYDRFLKNEFYSVSLTEIKQIFNNCNKEEFKQFFLMEYLPKEKYSVDILINRSIPAVSVCRKKIFPVSSPTQIAEITHEKDIIEYAEKIASLLQFDYFVQIEIGRNKKGTPCLIEINPRIDATLPIVEGIGINYFQEMIYYALFGKFREDLFKLKYKPQRFYRYWEHIFEKKE